jgi:hypothetical protein
MEIRGGPTDDFVSEARLAARHVVAECHVAEWQISIAWRILHGESMFMTAPPGLNF